MRFERDPGAIGSALRREIHSLDPTLAIFDAETIEEHLRDALFLPRLTGTLFGAFGFLGLALAAIGIYGVMNSWVSRRTREIGIRLALGARIGEVKWFIVRQGMLLTGIAVIPGLAATWAIAQALYQRPLWRAARRSADFRCGALVPRCCRRNRVLVSSAARGWRGAAGCASARITWRARRLAIFGQTPDQPPSAH